MTQAVFYAMVVNEALELGILSSDLAGHLKLSLEGLWWQCVKLGCSLTTVPLCGRNTTDRLIQGAGPGSANGQEENSGSSDAPPPSSDDEES